MDLHVSDSVVVKSGVLDPDLDNEISGWQGRIEEVDDEGTVLIRWDSVTLREMGLDTLIQCEEEGLDWELMTLDGVEVEKAAARDTEADVSSAVNQLKAAVADHLRLADEDETDDEE